jgi:hypothetical protein
MLKGVNRFFTTTMMIIDEIRYIDPMMERREDE